DLVEPGAVALFEPAVPLALVQRLLLGDELVDAAQYLAVVHPRSSRAAAPTGAGPLPRPSARRPALPPAARRESAFRSRPRGRTCRFAGAPRPARRRPAVRAGRRSGPGRTRSDRCPTRRRRSRSSTARRWARAPSGAAQIRSALARRRAAHPLVSRPPAPNLSGSGRRFGRGSDRTPTAPPSPG